MYVDGRVTLFPFHIPVFIKSDAKLWELKLIRHEVVWKLKYLGGV